MLVSIQLICVAISIIFTVALSIGKYVNARWLTFRDGILHDLMFEFVILTVFMTLMVTILQPY